MADEKTLDSVEKQELESEQEQTVPGKFYRPYTDIHETTDGLVVTMEVPGVAKSNLDIGLEKDVLSVEGRVDSGRYEDLEPLYTEYNVGHFRRSFTISSKIDRDQIAANIEDGVLTLHLPKMPEAAARKIEVA